MFRITTILVLSLFCKFTLAQSQLSFKSYDTKDGLSQSTVESFLYDSKGFMWIGTRAGLDKYDGYSFKAYTNNIGDAGSISNDGITDLVEDSNKNIWVGTINGLNFYNRDLDTFTHNFPKSLHDVNIEDLYFDKPHNLWISTQVGLIKFDPQANSFKNYTHSENQNSIISNVVRCTISDKNGNLWIGTADGLDMLKTKTDEFSHFQNNSLETSISDNYVEVLFLDSKGNLWIGTKNGLNLLSADNKFIRFMNDPQNSKSLCNNSILSIEEDNNGKIWIGTENGGLSILETSTNLFTNYQNEVGNTESIAHNSIDAIYKDPLNNMWLGTFAKGFSVCSLNKKKFLHYKFTPTNDSGLNCNIINAFKEDSHGNIWIATDGGGLNVFNPKSNNFISYKANNKIQNSIGGNYATSLTIDRDENIWLTTWAGGVTFFDRKKKKFTVYKKNISNNAGLTANEAFDIIEDHNGDLWIATYGGGLNKLDRKTNKFTYYTHNNADSKSLKHNLLLRVFEDSRNQIWVCGVGTGLALLDQKTNTFLHYMHNEKDPFSISHNVAVKIYEDVKANIWVATNEGLNCFNQKTKKFKRYYVQDGLPSNNVESIIEDRNGNFWIGTNKGLCYFDYKNQKFITFNNTSEGLQGLEFNSNAAMKSRSGLLYMGGRNGFNIFNPDSILKKNLKPPAIVITDFQLFNKPVKISCTSPLQKNINDADEILLNYSESVFSFEFSALNFSTGNNYAYIMEGFDKGWNYIGGKRAATYTNLDPGEYTFKVKAANSDGIWNEKGRSVKIVIIPPLWQTWWFRSLLAALLIICTVAFYRIRLNLIEKQKIYLKKILLEQTSEIINKNDELEAQANNLQRLNEVILKKSDETERARKEADKANQAKSAFLATMSHEIRTPMNGVLGMASLLNETSLTKEQQEYATTIINSGEALLTIINDILDFSKIESGNFVLDNHDFDLRQCVEDVMDLFASKAAKINLELVYYIDKSVPARIFGDSHRLRQILINLIGNAVKFTSQGEVLTAIDVIQIAKNDLEIGFKIKDTGIGIRADKISKLFKAFSQTDSSTTREYGGTGLGLVISRHLVELMGGSIKVESVEGKGTEFHFNIKCKACLPPPIAQQNKVAITYEGKSVLVVDDNITSLGILKRELEQLKFIVTEVTSPLPVAELISKSKFDLIITDFEMPEMDGVSLAKLIRSKSTEIPVILLNGIDSKKKIDSLFNSILCKPVKQYQLHNAIHRIFDDGYTQDLKSDNRNILFKDFAVSNPLRILLVEDNLVNQALALRVLSKLGYTNIEVAMNGAQALEKSQNNFFQLILMDIQMPIMDGIEATREIRKISAMQPIIIAMTADVLQDDKDACFDAGMNDFISKPFRWSDLMSVLEKASLFFNGI